MEKTFDERLDELLAQESGEQLSFKFETDKTTNSKPMSGEEYKQKIAQATERYIKRRELHYATNNNQR